MYNVTAYCLRSNVYVEVPSEFFEVRNQTETIQISGDGTDCNFANYNLKITDLPAVDLSVYKYIILKLQVYDKNNNYVNYKIYFAERADKLYNKENIVRKHIIEVAFSLDPSPPAP